MWRVFDSLLIKAWADPKQRGIMRAEAAQYLLTLADEKQLPDLFNGEFLKGHREPRIAMVGRSNVGKSTLINALFERRLAQTSNKPGKTRAIHFYLWPAQKRIIADLPGYGFAQTSQTERKRWQRLISAYFDADPNMEQIFLLLDARHGPTKNDLEAIEFLSLRGIPVTFIFTKVDTLKTQSIRAQRKKEVTQALSEIGISYDSVFWVSSETKAGLKSLVMSLSGRS